MRLFGICCSLIIDNFDKLSRGFLEEDKIQLFIIWREFKSYCVNVKTHKI